MPNVLGNDGSAIAMMDAQELADREEAAQAYAGESPDHFIEYGEACKHEAEEDEASKERRQIWSETWDAYRLRRPTYDTKEDWQSKAVTADPFRIVQQGKRLIRQSLIDRPDFFAFEGQDQGPDLLTAKFHTESIKFWGARTRGNLPGMFSTACEMAFATGQSLEMIPYWERINGVDRLLWHLPPPWHIRRDPSSDPGRPWSGMYWIDTEWIDEWRLRELADQGQIINLDEAKAGRDGESKQEAEDRQKRTQWNRNKFRKALCVNDFWGVVLDPQGQLLLPNCHYMWSGHAIIMEPAVNPYPAIRWPGVSFSPIPDPLGYFGRGLLEAVIKLWKLSDNILNLAMDDFNWIVNRMFELCPEMLMDGWNDYERYPGKIWHKKSQYAAQRAIQEVQVSRSQSTEAQQWLDYLQQKVQDGSFVTAFLMALPGERSNITLGEVELKNQEGHGMFESIGTEIEQGLANVIVAMRDVLAVNWTDYSSPSLQKAFGDGQFAQFMASLELADQKTRMEALRLDADVVVSGISAALKKADLLRGLDLLMQKAESPVWAPYFKRYPMIKTAVDALDFGDKGFLEDEQQAMMNEELQRMAAAGMVPGAPGAPGPGGGQPGGPLPTPPPGGAPA